MFKPEKRQQLGVIENVELKGVKIPIYAGVHHGKRSFVISYYSEGVRKRERYPTQDKARVQAKAKIQDLVSGAGHVGTFTPRQTATISESVEILRGIGGGIPMSRAVREYAEAIQILNGQGSLSEAATFFVKEAAKRAIPRKMFTEVVGEFLEYIQNTGLSAQYLRDSTTRLGRAAKVFRGPIGSISTEEIEAWLSIGSKSPRHYNNERNAVVTLFNFARKKGYLSRDVETAAGLTSKRKDVSKEIQILTPEAFAVLLKNTPPKFIPYVAMGGLAGLRTAEISRLECKEIDFAQGHILVTALKAKTSSRRLVPICSALRKWLLPLKKREGKVMPYASDQSMLCEWTEVKAKMLDERGKSLVKVPVNALRHSYASYRLALVQDAQQVSLEMGNSPRKLFANYRQLVTKAQAKLWFDCGPQRQ